MDPINGTSTQASVAGAAPTNSFAELGSDDFLKLLIMQLRNQDPLEPVGNEELLRQISSVRDIELSTTLADSLRVLTGQQRFASASAFIGQYVTGVADEDGVAKQGVVVGVRFTEAGRPMLELANGSELPVEQVSTIEPPLRAAEALIGQPILGVDRRNPAEPRVVEGVVTAIRNDSNGEVLLELDSGDDLRFRDLMGVSTLETV